MRQEDWLLFPAKAARRWLHGASLGRRCAVLIDGDNAAPSIAKPVMQFATTLGHIRHAEVFANFASPSSAGWAAQMRTHALVGQQAFSATPGKNAADISMAIRAMDLVHREDVDDFVLVSTDADFSALAHRIRRSGAHVHGVGSWSSPRALRESCTSFRTFAELRGIDDAATPPARWSLQPDAAEDILLTALARLGGGRQWVDVTMLAAELKRTSSSFDHRAYSRQTLTDLCDALDSIDVDPTPDPPRVRIALREIRTG